MADNASPADSGGDSARFDITTLGGSAAPPSDIPTEHRPYAEKLLRMDAINDVPGSASVPGRVKLSRMTVETLAPEMRAEVYAALDALPPEDRAAAEHDLVAQRVRKELPSIRLKSGHGEGASDFHREMLSVTRQWDDLRRESDNLRAELDRVAGFDVEVDPETGEEYPKERLAIQDPARRRGYEATIADIERRMRLLIAPDGNFGLEGKKRVDEALAASAATLYRRDQEAAKLAQVKRRAAEINHEKEVEARAQSLARMMRGGAD